MRQKPNCDCFICEAAQSESVGIAISKSLSVFEKEVWNRAIEAAALAIPKYEDDDMNDIRENIRKLKK